MIWTVAVTETKLIRAKMEDFLATNRLQKEFRRS